MTRRSQAAAAEFTSAYSRLGPESVKRVAAAGTSSREVRVLALGHFTRRNF